MVDFGCASLVGGLLVKGFGCVSECDEVFGCVSLVVVLGCVSLSLVFCWLHEFGVFFL